MMELVQSQKRGRFAHRWLPMLAGLVIDTSVKIAGFPVLGFSITPLARLFSAATLYIWLLDLLVHDFKRGLSASNFSSPAGTPYTENGNSLDSAATGSSSSGATSSPSRRGPAPLLPPKPLRLLVTSPFRVDSPRKTANSLSPSVAQAQASLAEIMQEESGWQHRKSLSIGPIIRRTSRLPSWLMVTGTGKSTGGKRGSSDSGDGILDVDIEQQAGPAELGSDCDSGQTASHHHKAGRTPSSSLQSIEQAPITKQSAMHSPRPSVSSTSGGRYDRRGTRLDSPIEVEMPFGGSNVSRSVSTKSSRITSPIAVRARYPIFAAANLPSMNEAVDEIQEGETRLVPTAASERLHATAFSNHSSYHSTPSGNPSLNSRESAISLSYFPRPPSPSSPKNHESTQSGTVPAGAFFQDKPRVHRRTSMASEGSLAPPQMPAALAHQHQHQLSWQSSDTFAGSVDSLVPPGEHGRGFNVTS